MKPHSLRYALGLVVTVAVVPCLSAAPAGRYVEGELLVKFKGGPRGASAVNAQRTLQHKVKRHFDFIGWQQIRLPAGTTVEVGLARYRNLPSVLAVEPNHLFRAASIAPDDPLYSQQYALEKIGASNAWDLTTGSRQVVVAVLDTGVNYHHEDLRDNLWRNPGEIPGNGIDDDANGFVDDVYGIDTADDMFGNDSDPADVDTQHTGYHGTACAGIIGAVGNNERGIAGVNWKVQIMAIRVVQQIDFISHSDAIQAWGYVLLMKQRGINIRVISMSWGGTDFSAAAQDACVALGNADIVQVSIAGNFSANNDAAPFYPGGFSASNMIAVAASDRSDGLASFSNYGRTNVDLAAPGVDIATTYAPGTNSYERYFNGTSAAAPFVAGAAALLFANNPGATAADVKVALLETVDHLPAFTNKMVSHGRLNVGRAILHPLVVPGPPWVVTHPQPQTVILSNTAVFQVTSAGDRPQHFQWRFHDLELPGATNSTLILTSAGFGHAGDYTVIVTNTLDAVTSHVARLTVVPLLITIQPQSQHIRPTSKATFSVAVSSPVPVTYQWRFNDEEIPGAIASTLLLTNVRPSHNGSYSVRVANEFGAAVSSNSTLAVLFNPVITLAPANNLTNVAGATFTLGAAIAGHPPPFFYVWRSNSAVVRTYFFTSATSDFVTVRAPATPGISNTFRLEVTNLFGATLITFTNRLIFTNHTVADSDGDGLPDGYESAYGGATGMLDPLGDADGDTLSNLAEYRAGTNPTNAASVLKIDSIRAGPEAALQFEAVANRAYGIEYSPAPGRGPWSDLTRLVPHSTHHTRTIFDSEPAAHRVYRVRVE